MRGKLLDLFGIWKLAARDVSNVVFVLVFAEGRFVWGGDMDEIEIIYYIYYRLKSEKKKKWEKIGFVYFFG